MAGAAMVAVEVVPPSRALAGASWLRGTISGSRAVLAGPKKPSALPYAPAAASRSGKDAVLVSSVAASRAAAAARAAREQVRIRPRGKRSAARPPASVRSRAAVL